MVPRVLVVEPHPGMRRQLSYAIRSVVVDVVEDFKTARICLVNDRPDVLVSNLRLDGYNGLHLVHLAAGIKLPMQSFIYTEEYEPGLAAEVAGSGATYNTFRDLLRHLPTLTETGREGPEPVASAVLQRG